MGIAFFDFDGTICTADSFLAFVRFARGRAAYWRGLLQLSPFIAQYLLKRYPNDRLKERFFAHYFGGMPEAELLALGEEFSAAWLPGRCRPALLDRLAWHRQRGNAVVVVTASSAIWLGGWCRAQGAELIGTEFEVVAGRYTGRLAGPNCHGERKRELVAARLAAQSYNPTFGYGNAPDDEPFLSLLQEVRYYAVGRAANFDFAARTPGEARPSA